MTVARVTSNTVGLVFLENIRASTQTHHVVWHLSLTSLVSFVPRKRKEKVDMSIISSVLVIACIIY